MQGQFSGGNTIFQQMVLGKLSKCKLNTSTTTTKIRQVAHMPVKGHSRSVVIRKMQTEPHGTFLHTYHNC